MATRVWRRRAAAVACGVGFGLTLGACGSGGSGATSSTGAAAGGAGCSAFSSYGSFPGSTVEIYSPVRDEEAKRYDQSFTDFTRCTGIAVKWNGSGEFETQIQVRVKGGSAPDLATIPQPGLLQTLVREGAVKKASDAVAAEAKAAYTKDWLAYGTVDGTFYAPPLDANVKSFVWYSPKDFKAAGYAIPKTWDELMKLTDTIAGKGQGKPWCVGIESGDATGWPTTDWVEDVLLRTQGPDVYDQWVQHKIPFNDPRVADAVDRVGSILKNEKYVNGGFGGVKSIATTSFQEGGAPILDGECWMHRQASFYANQWKKGTKIGEDGDVYAFYLPPIDPAKGKPVLGAGEFLAAFNDKPQTQAVQRYMNSEEWVNRKARIGDWITANKLLKTENVLIAGTSDPNPILVQSVSILQDPQTVFRFDGSDQMPSAVGAGSFWKQMTAWVSGQATAPTLAAIEASWPKS